MLSPNVDQGTLALTRAKERGKQRAENKESSASKLLILLKEMKEEMRKMEELRWRDNHLEDQIKEREHSSSNPLIEK